MYDGLCRFSFLWFGMAEARTGSMALQGSYHGFAKGYLSPESQFKAEAIGCHSVPDDSISKPPCHLMRHCRGGSLTTNISGRKVLM